jgi:hypothetical protein
MSKEFREMSHNNIPRTQNRISIKDVKDNNTPVAQIESESSSPSISCSPTNEG